MNEQHASDDQQSVFAVMRRQIAVTPLPAPRRPSLRERFVGRSRVALGGAGGLIAVAAAAVAAGVFSAVPPAVAITTTADGLRVTLNDLSALGALNAKLAHDNLPVRVVPAKAGCTATVREVEAKGLTPPQTVEAGHASAPIGSIGIAGLRRPPSGYTFIVGISSDRRWATLSPREIREPAPACVGEATPPRGR